MASGEATPGLLTEAVDVLRQWPDFASDYLDVRAFHTRLHLPNRVGQLRVVHTPKGRVVYTWTRHLTPNIGLPTEKYWTPKGRALWLQDIFWDPSMTAREAIRAALDDGVQQGIAKIGETVLFWRQQANRYGYIKIRKATMSWAASQRQ